MKGLRVTKLLDKILEIHENYNKKIEQVDLEEWLGKCLRRNPPPLTRKNRLNHFKSIEMVDVAPPTLIVKVNVPSAVHFSYDRYLQNRFYEKFPYEGVPIKFIYAGSSVKSEDKDKKA
jgi:GTP-binding protein